MSKLNLLIDKCTIENTDESKGYIYVRTNGNEPGEVGWIEIHGNQDPADYPLTLESDEQIDDFAQKLKSILHGTSFK